MVKGSEAVLVAAVGLLVVVPGGTAITATFERGEFDWPRTLAKSKIS